MARWKQGEHVVSGLQRFLLSALLPSSCRPNLGAGDLRSGTLLAPSSLTRSGYNEGNSRVVPC